MFGEERVRALLKPADPARDLTAPPSRPAARDLILRADEATEVEIVVGPPVAARRPGRVPRRLVLSAGALATVAAAGGAGLLRLAGTGSPAGAPLPSGTAPTPGPAEVGEVLTPMAFSVDEDARPHLRALAGRIVDAPYDGRRGRYAYKHLRRWSEVEVENGYGMGYATDEKTWSAADGTGRSVLDYLDPQFPDESSRTYWQERLPKKPRSQVTALGEATARRQYDLGRVPSGMSPLTSTVPTGGVIDRLVSVAFGHERYVLPRPSRLPVLYSLVDLPRLRWRGEAPDRAGRLGMAVSYDDRHRRQRVVLIFDPTTGELLGWEHMTTGPDRLNQYTVILDTDRTNQYD